MILDIILLLIFTTATLRGKRKGFASSLIKFAALAGGLVLGVVFTKPFCELLTLTGLDRVTSSNIAALAKSGNGKTVDFMDFLPEVIRKTLGVFGVDNISADIREFTSSTMLVLSFLSIILITHIVSFVLRRKLGGERKKQSLIGSADAYAGLLLGMLKGAALVFLFLALMLPVAGILLPDRVHDINEALNNSYIAGSLYDINPLISFIKHLHL